jgi:probable F420-dependent oxidoreductase
LRSARTVLDERQPVRHAHVVDRISIGVQAEPRDIDSWLALARRLEAAGFDALLMGDHPGSGASPWPGLGAAAAATQTLRLGTYMLQTGVREPVHAAADAASLDVLAPGRVVLGLGAGHTFREWEETGRSRPSASARAQRLAEFVDAVAGLLAGERVHVEGAFVRLDDAYLEDLPVGLGRVCLVVGGGNREVLRTAAARADVVALSGLGRTLPDGHRHEPRWSRYDLEEQLRFIDEEAGKAGRQPAIEALVHVVTVTEDRDSAAAAQSSRIGAPVGEILGTPFALIGTPQEMADQLLRQADELGISRYVIRETAIDCIEKVLPLIRP